MKELLFLGWLFGWAVVVQCLWDPEVACPADPALCCLVSPNWEALHGDFDRGVDPF